MIGKRISIFNKALKLIEDKGFQSIAVRLTAKKTGVFTGIICRYLYRIPTTISSLHPVLRIGIFSATFYPCHGEKSVHNPFKEGWLNLCKYPINHPLILNFVEQLNFLPYTKMKILSGNHYHYDFNKMRRR